MRSRVQIAALTALLAALCFPTAAGAEPAPPAAQSTVLFQDVRIFDGKSGSLSAPANVLVRGNKIDKISTGPIAIDDSAGVTTINGRGKTLMPGLIDVHWHAMLVRPNPVEAMASDIGYLNLLAGRSYRHPDARLHHDPRHGRACLRFETSDRRRPPAWTAHLPVRGRDHSHQRPRRFPFAYRSSKASRDANPRRGDGRAMIADSPDEVRMRAREQLMQGASQIKLTAGGGVASPFSPLDVVTFTEPELRAAVEAAENWGTYVCTHATRLFLSNAPSPRAKCIEHGHLMDDETARLMADKGIWLSTQPFLEEARRRSAAWSFGTGEKEQVMQGPTTCTASRRSTVSRPRSAPTSCFRRAKRAAGKSLGRTRPLVHARRSADHGNVNKRRIACSVRSSQSLSRQARRGRRGCIGRPALGGR